MISVCSSNKLTILPGVAGRIQWGCESDREEFSAGWRAADASGHHAAAVPGVRSAATSMDADYGYAGRERKQEGAVSGHDDGAIEAGSEDGGGYGGAGRDRQAAGEKQPRRVSETFHSASAVRDGFPDGTVGNRSGGRAGDRAL
jgi:hypothetical protein